MCVLLVPLWRCRNYEGHAKPLHEEKLRYLLKQLDPEKTAQACALPCTGLNVLITATAEQNDRLIGLVDPMTILLVGLTGGPRRALLFFVFHTHKL